jgi:ribosomal protein L7/L12
VPDDLTISEQHDVKIVDSFSPLEAPRGPHNVQWDKKFDLTSVGQIIIDRIEMIKLVRAISGWGLKESKDWVERLVPKP